MIPKIIHYCWLSGEPYPADLKKYMKTWKKILPEYEFILWDTNRFDVNSSIWVKQAYECKKYAFAADYIRLYALFHFGGIYLDTDVEVLRSYNPLLMLDVIAGYDHINTRIEFATFGSVKGSPFLKDLLDYYDNKTFIKENGELDIVSMPDIATQVLKEKGYKLISVKDIHEALNCRYDKVIPVFPREWFCPQNWYDYKLNKTNNTYSIHHYKGAWLPDQIRKEREILRRLGPYIPRVWRRIQHLYGKLKL